LRTVSTGFSNLFGNGETFLLRVFRAEFVIRAPDHFDGDRSGDIKEIIVCRTLVAVGVKETSPTVFERLKLVNEVVLTEVLKLLDTCFSSAVWVVFRGYECGPQGFAGAIDGRYSVAKNLHLGIPVRTKD